MNVANSLIIQQSYNSIHPFTPKVEQYPTPAAPQQAPLYEVPEPTTTKGQCARWPDLSPETSAIIYIYIICF